MKYIVFLAIIGYTAAIDLIGRTQSAAVRGRLTCNGKPAAGVRVKLYDSDNSFLPGVLDTDDLMDASRTNSKGEYFLSGSTKEITTIEPYLAIYHDCNDWLPCQRTVRVGIPSKYITRGKTPKSTFDAGQLELASKYPNEGRSCFHRPL